MTIYERLKELNIEIPTPPKVGGLYKPVKKSGNQLFVSGQGPVVNNEAMFIGKLGADRTIEEGQEAARICVINMLSVLQDFIGDLDKIKGVVKLFGLVSSAQNFNEQPKVINGASQLLIDIFEEDGWHTRSAVGTNELPGNISVEIEAIFELKY